MGCTVSRIRSGPSEVRIEISRHAIAPVAQGLGERRPQADTRGLGASCA